jgi:hypothetical protein
MKLLNIYSVGIGALFFGLISTPAMAITIDLFQNANGGFQSVSDNNALDSTPVTDTQTFSTGVTGVIGGQRTIQVNKRTGIPLSAFASSLTIIPSSKLASFSSADTVTSDFSITWDGNYGSNGIDLTEGGTQKYFLLDIKTNDLNGTSSLPLTFEVQDIGGATSTFSSTIVPGQKGNTLFSFANTSGGANLSQAKYIKLSATDTPESLDMSFAFVGTAVPFEFSPSTGLLFVGGLFGISKLKKKLKSC